MILKHLYNMHNKLLLLVIILFFAACSKKKIQVEYNEIVVSTKDRLNKIKFFDANIGFIVGGDQYTKATVLKTINGGATWEAINLPTNNEQKEIYSFDILPNGQIVTVGYGGTIYLSDDTGKTFRYVQHHSWKELKDVACINSAQALIVGGTGFNSGHHSQFDMDGLGNNVITQDYNFEISDVDFVNDKLAYMCGYGALLKSTDGGVNWNHTSAKNDFFKAMCWKNAQEGITVGYEGSIHKTTDGSDSWVVVRNGNDITKKKVHFFDVARNSTNRIVAVGERGVVFISLDDGDSWAESNKFTYDDLRGVTFKDEATIFCVGDKGRVFEVKF